MKFGRSELDKLWNRSIATEQCEVDEALLVWHRVLIEDLHGAWFTNYTVEERDMIKVGGKVTKVKT